MYTLCTLPSLPYFKSTFVRLKKVPSFDLIELILHLICLSTFQVLVAVLPQAKMQYFNVETKVWKPLASLAPAAEATDCFCAETVGSNLYVAGSVDLYCYDIERNVWAGLPLSSGVISSLCIAGDYMYAISSNCNKIPQRYSFADLQWQSFAKVNVTGSCIYAYSGATVLHSKVFVLYGKATYTKAWRVHNAVLHCFDPVRNLWEEKASTCQPHFESSLLVVNSRLYVAGGYGYIDANDTPSRNSPAPVEIYDEENNKWSVVEQKRIPPNKLGAVEIESRVYFIINKFPVDSGIRIPPGELYPVPLDKWTNLRNISEKAALCYVPLKRESLKTE